MCTSWICQEFDIRFYWLKKLESLNKNILKLLKLFDIKWYLQNDLIHNFYEINPIFKYFKYINTLTHIYKRDTY